MGAGHPGRGADGERSGRAPGLAAAAGRRALSTWLSPRDLIALVQAALAAPAVGCLVAYGCSRNTRRWWKTDDAWARLGYAPQDDAEAHAAEVEDRLLPEGPQRNLQGGSFLGIGPFDLGWV